MFGTHPHPSVYNYGRDLKGGTKAPLNCVLFALYRHFKGFSMHPRNIINLASSWGCTLYSLVPTSSCYDIIIGVVPAVPRVLRGCRKPSRILSTFRPLFEKGERFNHDIGLGLLIGPKLRLVGESLLQKSARESGEVAEIEICARITRHLVVFSGALCPISRAPLCLLSQLV